MSRDVFVCPKCQRTVEHRVRQTTDKRTGKRKYAGEYLACPNFKKSCDYAVSPEKLMDDKSDPEDACSGLVYRALIKGEDITLPKRFFE